MTRMVLAAMAAMLVITGCGGGGDDEFQGGPPGGGGGPPQLPSPASAPALKTVLAGQYGVVNFPIGAAIEPASTNASASDTALLLKHFSSVTAENAMKPDSIWPNLAGSNTQPAAQPNFINADVIYQFALTNNIRVRGHTLLWHQTAPSWFFAGDQSDPAAYRISVQQNLCQYIDAVMKHFPEVYAWDVVNEVASDTAGGNPYRTNSDWYEAYSVGGMDGSDYVTDAFLCATQTRAAMGKNDGNMKLMINDYNTELVGKRANVLAILQDVRNSGTGADIDGVGHQFHLMLNQDVAQVTAAFAAVEAIDATLVNHVTELDVSIYADPGECFALRTIPPCLPDVGNTPAQTLLSQQALKYRALFNAFDRPSVTSVTLWGIADNHTWLNFFPVNRTNYPLLFDRSGNPKWAFWAVVDQSITVP